MSRRLCEIHVNVDYVGQWGCPDCVAELRAENRELAAQVAVLVEAVTKWFDCGNCGGQRCMSCVLREYHQGCTDDCPDCSKEGTPLPVALLAGLSTAAKALLDRLAQATATATEWGKRIVALEHERDEVSTENSHLKDRLAQAERAIELLREHRKQAALAGCGRNRIEISDFLAEIEGESHE